MFKAQNEPVLSHQELYDENKRLKRDNGALRRSVDQLNNLLKQIERCEAGDKIAIAAARKAFKS